jgi:superfamily II DNA or RNA helicase
MGLSATYSRQFDEPGTGQLLDWFGPVLEPVVGLVEALFLRLLVPYDYRLHSVKLSEQEVIEYEELTQRLRTLSAIRGANEPLTEDIKLLLIRRAKVLKQAASKVPAAIEILTKDYISGDRWLVYCDDVDQLQLLVREALGCGLPVMEFYYGMQGDRAAVLKSLAEQGGIVIAIKCLDEGVDIPNCDNALILASSTVSREYIQRRGRVLRTAPGKTHAVIHDLLLVDDGNGVLAKSEAMRALEFARLARNPGGRARLRYHLALSRDVTLPTDWLADEEDAEEAGEETIDVEDHGT